MSSVLGLNRTFISTLLHFQGHDAAKPVQQFLGSITDADLLRRACQGVHCVMHIAGVRN